MTDYEWFIADVNPEPWAIGDLGVGRKGGKYYPTVGRNHQMYAYQQSIKEALRGQERSFTAPIDLCFYFYRSIATYQSHQARTARSHEADATNLQKATEDALQGVFYKNDKDVTHVESYFVEQDPATNGKVVIGIRNTPRIVLPPAVQALIDELEFENDFDPNEWHG